MTKRLGTPSYLSHFQDQTKTGRNEGGQGFREDLYEFKNPIHLFQKSGCFRDLDIHIDVIWTKIFFFEEMLRVAIRIFGDNICCGFILARIHLRAFQR